MNLNDYEAIWKRQELPVGSAADLTTLRETFETKRRKLAKILYFRDVLEGTTGLLVSGVFAYMWWHIGKDGWPIALAICLILGVTGFFLRERIRTHRNRLGPDVTLLAKLEAELAELRHQRRLLLNIWSWYLAPCAGAIVIMVATMVKILVSKGPPGFLASFWEHPAALAWIIFYFAIVLPLCFWGAWAINRRAVRKQIEPRLEELEKLHRDLTSSS
jgi:hypothetical protein